MYLSDETPSAEAVDNSFWSVLKEALRGSHRDLTEGSIVAAIVILAIPMVLEMGMESLFAIVDIFFVAKLGANSIAVVSLTESVLALIYAVAIGVSIGATATVARRIGEKNAEEAAHTATHIVYLGVIVSAIMAVIGIVAAPYIYQVLGAEQSVIDIGLPFMRIMYGSNAVIVFLFLLNAIFRGAGDAAIAMRVLILANGLNIVLGPMFIFGIGFFPELGVTGAAVATVIGRGSGVLLAAYSLFIRKGGRIEVHSRHWKFDPKLLWSLVRLSATAVLQFLIATASWSGLIRVVAGFGTVAIAGYQVGLRVIMFVLLPAVGLANAAATLVGQNLGAGKPERAERSVWIAGIINAIFLGSAGLLFLFFSDSVARIFTTEPDVLKYASDCLFIVAFGYAFYGIGMVVETSFNGAGDTITPTYLNLFVFWLFEIPLAYLLAYHFEMGPEGVFWSVTIAFSVLAVVSALIFKRGKWKLKTV
jgi:putative MATE family efflux protein